MFKTFTTAATLLLASLGAAAQSTPAGLWKTFADDGTTPRALVRISERNGTLAGTVEQLFGAAQNDARCQRCSGERQGQPVLGLALLHDLRAEAGDPAAFSGELLDPGTGTVYRTRLKAVDGGTRLQVRAYSGPLYRTQNWVRVQ